MPRTQEPIVGNNAYIILKIDAVRLFKTMSNDKVKDGRLPAHRKRAIAKGDSCAGRAASQGNEDRRISRLPIPGPTGEELMD